MCQNCKPNEVCRECRKERIAAQRAEIKNLYAENRAKMTDAERRRANARIKQSRENWLYKKPQDEIDEILNGYKESSRAASMCARARKLNSPKIEKFTKAEIIQRDGYFCYLCGELLNDLTVTLDHIIPLSKGGEHTPENVRVCCLSCNLKKGSKIV